MLTRKFSHRVARLLNTYGELRPGHNADASKFEGPLSASEKGGGAKAQRSKKSKKKVARKYHYDQSKGEYVVSSNS